MLEINNITLTYPSGKGIFDINIKMKKGQVLGYLGPNGSGKTTTIRAILGFMKTEKGNISINGLNAFDDAHLIMNFLGYLPGEICLPANIKGEDFLNHIVQMRKIKDTKYMYELIDRFELDLKGDIKKYSKGMKQKLGIIVAFMHNPQILILDEPTSGLDPLMQNKFIELVLEEKAKGKTILMSSHIFEEIEKTCDEVIIIKEGKIVSKFDIAEMKSHQRKAFIIKTDEQEKLKNLKYVVVQKNNNEFEVVVKGEEIDTFIKDISKIKVLNFEQKIQSLEEVFLNFYGKVND